MTTDFSAQFTAQWMLTVRNLFDRGMSGWRLQPPLPAGIENQYFTLLFGDHNADAIVFRDRDGEQIMGIKLFCQCEICLVSQADFCLRKNVEIVGQGERSTSILFDGSGGVQFLTSRSTAALLSPDLHRACRKTTDSTGRTEGTKGGSGRTPRGRGRQERRFSKDRRVGIILYIQQARLKAGCDQRGMPPVFSKKFSLTTACSTFVFAVNYLQRFFS